MRNRSYRRSDRRLRLEILERRRVLTGIANGETLIGGFAEGGSDQFEFTVEQSEFIRVAVVDQTGITGNSQPDPVLQIVDPNGTVLTSSSPGEQLSGRDDDSAFFQFESQLAGEYIAIVSESLNDVALDYSIRLLTLPGSPSLIAGQDEFLSNGEEFDAALPLNGMNVHQFDVEANDLVRVSIGNFNPVGASSFAGPRLQIIDPNGKRIALDSDNSPLITGDVEQAHAQFTATLSGTYTALVLEEDSNAPLDYRIRLFTLPGTPDPIEGRDGTLENGVVVNSQFELGVMNYHQFTVEQGEFIRVAVVDQTGITGNSQPDPVLQIVDPNGAVLTSSSPGEQLSGRDDDSAFFQFESQLAGEYTAIVSESLNDAALDYSIRLLTLPGSPSLITGQDEFLSNGEEFDAALPLNGMNVHQFDVEANDLVRVSIGNFNPVGASSFAGPRLQIIDPNGKRIALDSDNSPLITGDVEQAHAQFTATLSGTYTALVLEEDSNAALDYRIRLLTLPDVNPIEIPERDIDLSNGQEATSSMPIGGFNVHQFDAVSGNPIRIAVGELNANSVSSGADPVLQLFDPNGVQVTAGVVRGTDEARAELIAPSTGTYTALIHEEGIDQELSYRIRFLTLPDFSPMEIAGRDEDLAAGQVFDSSLPLGGFNVHQFSAVGGDDVQLVVDELNVNSSSSGADPIIQLFGPDGAMLTFGVSNQRDQSTATFEALQTGVYTAFIREEFNDQLLDYRVSLSGTSAVDVASVQINDGADQRSQITSLTVTFDGVTAVSSGAFSIINRADSSLVNLSANIATVAGNTVATISFNSGLNVDTRGTANSLSDGNFELLIDSSRVAGLATDYRFGDDEVDSFFRLFGDTDGDRDVDGQDYGRFGLTFLKSSVDAEFNPILDSDGDADVDGQDYGRFGLRFLTQLDF